MRIIGCDLHAAQQTIAMLDGETGEVGRDVARPRRTGSQAIGQVDCRERHDWLLNPAIENDEVSCGEPMDRLAIPIQYRDIDLNDVRGGPENRHLLGAARQEGSERDSGDHEDCVRSSHRLSRNSVWILSLPRSLVPTLASLGIRDRIMPNPTTAEAPFSPPIWLVTPPDIASASPTSSSNRTASDSMRCH